MSATVTISLEEFDRMRADLKEWERRFDDVNRQLKRVYNVDIIKLAHEYKRLDEIDRRQAMIDFKLGIP